jgi:hypothetical protein
LVFSPLFCIDARADQEADFALTMRRKMAEPEGIRFRLLTASQARLTGLYFPICFSLFSAPRFLARLPVCCFMQNTDRIYIL